MSNLTEDQLIEDEWVAPESDQSGITIPIRARWIMDGAETLEEALQMINLYAKYLEGLIEDGFILIDTVENDYGLAVPPES